MKLSASSLMPALLAGSITATQAQLPIGNLIRIPDETIEHPSLRFGNDLRTVDDIASPEVCLDECLSDQQCTSWTYTVSTKICTLKDGMPPGKPEPIVSSNDMTIYDDFYSGVSVRGDSMTMVDDVEYHAPDKLIGGSHYNSPTWESCVNQCLWTDGCMAYSFKYPYSCENCGVCYLFNTALVVYRRVPAWENTKWRSGIKKTGMVLSPQEDTYTEDGSGLSYGSKETLKVKYDTNYVLMKFDMDSLPRNIMTDFFFMKAELNLKAAVPQGKTITVDLYALSGGTFDYDWQEESATDAVLDSPAMEHWLASKEFLGSTPRGDYSDVQGDIKFNPVSFKFLANQLIPNAGNPQDWDLEGTVTLMLKVRAQSPEEPILSVASKESEAEKLRPELVIQEKQVRSCTYHEEGTRTEYCIDRFDPDKQVSDFPFQWSSAETANPSMDFTTGQLERTFLTGRCGQYESCASRRDIGEGKCVVKGAYSKSGHDYKIYECGQQKVHSCLFNKWGDDNPTQFCVEQLDGGSNFPVTFVQENNEEVRKNFGALYRHSACIDNLRNQKGTFLSTRYCSDRGDIGQGQRKTCTHIDDFYHDGEKKFYGIYDCGRPQYDLDVKSDRKEFFNHAALDAVKMSEGSYHKDTKDVHNLFPRYFSNTAVTYRSALGYVAFDNMVVGHREGGNDLQRLNEVCMVALSGVAADPDDKGAAWLTELDAMYKLGGSEDDLGTIYGVKTPKLIGASVARLVRKGAINKMIECYNRCTSPDCGLVIVGHSAGSAKAMLLSNILDESYRGRVPDHWIYQPLMLNFGPMNGIANSHYHRVKFRYNMVYNMIRAPGEAKVVANMYFDQVPYSFRKLSRYGSDILMPRRDDLKWYKYRVWHPNGASADCKTSDYICELSIFDIHKIGNYKTMVSMIGDNVSVNGFRRYKQCLSDSNCRSNGCNFISLCTKA